MGVDLTATEDNMRQSDNHEKTVYDLTVAGRRESNLTVGHGETEGRFDRHRMYRGRSDRHRSLTHYHSLSLVLLLSPLPPSLPSSSAREGRAKIDVRRTGPASTLSLSLSPASHTLSPICLYCHGTLTQ